MNVDNGEWRNIIMLKSGGGGRGGALVHEGIYHLCGAVSQEEVPRVEEEGTRISESDLFGS